MPEPQSLSTSEQITLARLDNQLAWYDRKSRLNQRLYKILKAVTIVSAAVIPVLTTSGVKYGAQIAAGLGVLIAVLEGLQQLNRYQSNWSSYRSTAASLEHEKYLYLAQAGPYLKADNPHALLAERVESLVSQENAKWFTSRNQGASEESPRAAS